MAKAKTKQIPEMKNLPSEQILAVLLEYIKDKQIPASNFNSKTSSNPLKKLNDVDDDKATYQKSINYFKESEKRNSNSEIYMDKKHKKKLNWHKEDENAGEFIIVAVNGLLFLFDLCILLFFTCWLFFLIFVIDNRFC